jgi:DNA topoisomerase-1
VRDITSQNVNDYLRKITGEDFTAKDFRTWAGTVLAAIALSAAGEFETKKQAKTNIKHAISAVAEVLGNTPAICQQCYIHPIVLETYLKGNSVNGLKQGTTKEFAEAAVLKLLQAGLSERVT